MSELKAGVIHTPHDEGMTFVTDSDMIRVNERETKFYIKSEADKVIAKLKSELDRYKRGWEESDRINAHLYAELRHSNYKRCLAMAQECEEAYNRECGLNPEEMTNKEFYRQ